MILQLTDFTVSDGSAVDLSVEFTCTPGDPGLLNPPELAYEPIGEELDILTIWYDDFFVGNPSDEDLKLLEKAILDNKDKWELA